MSTTNDLLGDTRSVGTRLPIDDQTDLSAGARSLIVTSTWLTEAMGAGADLAHAAVQNLATLLPCQAAAGDACAQQFIETFGKRAFRRPVAPTETTRLMAIYAMGRTNVDFAHGIELVIQAMLLSPNFLYKIELGAAGAAAAGGQIQLTPYEVASRLSYMFWGTMPDSALLAAADTGKLGSRPDVRAQAMRMVNNPLARETLIYLHKRWLGLDQIGAATKDATKYPNFGPDMTAAMDTEAHNFLDSVVWPQGSGLQALLTSTTTSANSVLAALYGVTMPASTAFTQVQLNPMQRSGILTLSSTIAVHTFADESEPVHRGKFVRERLLCQTLPDPPATVMATPPSPKPGIPIRDRFAEHSSGTACQPCHKMMDPIGFGFEHYDGLGVWRDTDQGKPVDATGSIVGSMDVDGPFDGIPNLARKLLQSNQVKDCVVSTFVGLTAPS